MRTFPKRENPQLVDSDSSDAMEEGIVSVSQLARKVQGAGARGWRSMASLFNKEDEHKLLTPDPSADHPLAAQPEDDAVSEKKTSGLWDVFANRWQMASPLSKNMAQSEFSERVAETSVAPGERAVEDANSSNGREAEETPFKWSFVTNKLAELRSKGGPKSN
ncbi:uncharacterized protein C1orf232 homolog isoform X2 [Rhinatrema bivittatum]|uniref:uncharacterized protein C1orf232 homolog isoform X2 n=1 Tax=Rhinatrema bivittatum TaxID=194408 RepID=UPI0011294202|nr:uncharacterized protein C1orf232 homolog isoform X2 [Rhinatrema bivittatum]